MNPRGGNAGTDTLGGRVALIVGGGGAIGTAIAERLSFAGANVVVADIASSEVVHGLNAAGYGGRAIAVGIDVTEQSSVRSAVKTVEREFGRLDIVVNSAMIPRRHGTVATLSAEDWEASMAVNLTGVFNVCQASLPLLSASPYGRIVTVGSRVWLSGNLPDYSAAKAGVVGLTRSLAREAGPHGVTVNVVAPSNVETARTRQTKAGAEAAERYVGLSPLGRLATPEDVAGAVHFLASDDAAFITGEVIHVCGGLQLPPL